MCCNPSVIYTNHFISAPRGSIDCVVFDGVEYSYDEFCSCIRLYDYIARYQRRINFQELVQTSYYYSHYGDWGYIG